MTDNNEVTSVLWIIAAIIGLGIACLLFNQWDQKDRKDNARQNIEKMRSNDPLW